MGDTLASLPMLTATAASVKALADDIHELLAHDPPNLDTRQTFAMLAYLSRTRERLQKVADWLATAGPTEGEADEDEADAADFAARGREMTPPIAGRQRSKR